MAQPRILIGTPTADVKNYCFQEWLENVDNFTYENFDLIIVDNSDDNGRNAQRIRERGVRTYWMNPKGKRLNEVMRDSLNLLRDIFIKEKYDYFFSLESDVFPPIDIIERLLDTNKKHVGAMYEIGYGENKFPLLQVIERTTFANGDYIVYGRQLSFGEMFSFIDGRVKDIHSCGLGCVLIHNSIIKSFDFRVNNESREGMHSDSFWYLDLWNAGINTYVHTGIKCGHKNMDWNRVRKIRERL